MKRIYISVIHRHLYSSQTGELGNIYVYDWESGTLLTNPMGIDPGYSLHTPLGKSHGSRGMAINHEELYVAGSGNRISVFDLEDYRLKRTFEIEEARGIHQIKWRDGVLWIASTGNDSLLAIENDKVKNITYLPDYIDHDIVLPFGHGRHAKHKWGEDRLHFNSMCWDEHGTEYHVYCAANMIYNFTKQEIVVADQALVSPHDIISHGGKLLINSSLDYTCLAIDKATKCTSVIHKTYPSEKRDNPYNMWGFTRGLVAHEGLVICGWTPVELASFRLTPIGYIPSERRTISTNPVEAIYDIALDPRDW